MKTINKKYAVLFVKPDSTELCSTWSVSHKVWQPAIFDDEEGATKFYDEINHLKGNADFEYRIVEVGIVI